MAYLWEDSISPGSVGIQVPVSAECTAVQPSPLILLLI